MSLSQIIQDLAILGVPTGVIGNELYLRKTGGEMSGPLLLSGSPTQDLEAATKLYVDNLASGIIVLATSRLTSTTNLTATYNNGTAGVGATLTLTSTGVLVIDGVNVALNDIILINGQTSQFQNGIYKCTTAGAVGVAAVLTRATYFDQASEIIEGAYTLVTSGNTYGGAGFIETGAGPFTVGTTPIVFTQFSSAATAAALLKANNLSDLTNVITALQNIRLPTGYLDFSNPGDLVLDKIPPRFISYSSPSSSDSVFLPDLTVSGALLPGHSFYFFNVSGHAATIKYADGTAWGTLSTPFLAQFFVAADGVTWLQQAAFIGINGVYGTDISLSTLDIPENTNLYYTDARADARIALQRNAANGLAGLDSGTKIPNTLLQATTTNIPEGTNLYYTAARINALKNVASGIAGLDADSKISRAQVPYQTIRSIIPAATTTISATNFAKLTSISACVVTIPDDSSIPVGFYETYLQIGTSDCSFTPASGVTILSLASALKIGGENGMVMAMKVDSVTWVLSGNLKV